jgi:hypothetical protein
MARLAFFGTPELAATCLRALLTTRHSVDVVVCQPDRPSGRGHKLEPSPVKALAVERGIPVLQPETLKKDTPSGEAFFAAFKDVGVDLAVVAAYGRIVPSRVLALPRREFVNVHASLQIKPSTTLVRSDTAATSVLPGFQYPMMLHLPTDEPPPKYSTKSRLCVNWYANVASAYTFTGKLPPVELTLNASATEP